MSRVVITGVGVVSHIGNTKEEFWNSLMEGKDVYKRQVLHSCGIDATTDFAFS